MPASELLYEGNFLSIRKEIAMEVILWDGGPSG